MNTIATNNNGTNFKLASQKWFCVGGDAGGNVQAGWRGDVAVARVYDDALTADQVAALWADVQTSVEKANVQSYRDVIQEGRTYLEDENLYAYVGDVTAYTEQLDLMDEYANNEDLQQLAIAVQTLRELRAALETSAAAYAAYRAEIASTQAYLEENQDFEGVDRDLLEDYLQSDEEPGETYTNGGALYILDNTQLPAEEIHGTEHKDFLF